MSMSNAEVYRLAAMLVANGNSCAPDCAYPCCGISKALAKDANDEYWSAQRPFVDMFLSTEWHGVYATKEDRLIASLALCFAAAMAETGDL